MEIQWYLYQTIVRRYLFKCFCWRSSECLKAAVEHWAQCIFAKNVNMVLRALNVKSTGWGRNGWHGIRNGAGGNTIGWNVLPQIETFLGGAELKANHSQQAHVCNQHGFPINIFLYNAHLVLSEPTLVHPCLHFNCRPAPSLFPCEFFSTHFLFKPVHRWGLLELCVVRWLWCTQTSLRSAVDDVFTGFVWTLNPSNLSPIGVLTTFRTTARRFT